MVGPNTEANTEDELMKYPSIPTQVTYELPGHQGRGKERQSSCEWCLLSTATFTFRALCARNSVDDMTPCGYENCW